MKRIIAFWTLFCYFFSGILGAIAAERKHIDILDGVSIKDPYKFPIEPITDSQDSYILQYACHANFVILKSAWNLEPTRPNVGYTSTVSAGCNPN